MSRRKRTRDRRPKRQRQAIAPKPEAKIKVNAMDVFRSMDAASKAVVRRHVTEDGYDNFISRIGLNNDNALSGGTYEFNLITRNRILLEAAYRGSWMVGRVVDTVAEDMTTAGVNVTTSEDDQDLKDLNSDFDKLKIWSSLRFTAKWGRLYGGAIGVMQIDGQRLDTPLRISTVGRGQFKGIVVFDRWQLNPVLSPVIQSGPDMGLPAYYQIVNNPQSYDPTSATATGQITVHHSRCFRFTGIDLPFFQAITEMMWGESILERLWDRLIAFDNATMSTAQLIDRASLRTVGIEGLREIVAAGNEAASGLQAQFEMMRLAQVNEGLTLLDKNDDYHADSYTFSGLPDTLLQFGQQLSGAAEIPLTRLFGQSPAGLNATGESDIRTYYDNIKAKQEDKFRNPMTRLLRVMWRNRYGQRAPKDLEFTFVPLWQTSAKEKSDIAKTNTDTIVEANEAGLISTPAAMKELRGLSKETGLYTNITDQDIADAEAEPPPLPDAAVPGDPTKPVDPADPVNTQPNPAEIPGAATAAVASKDAAWKRLTRWLHGKG